MSEPSRVVKEAYRQNVSSLEQVATVSPLKRKRSQRATQPVGKHAEVARVMRGHRNWHKVNKTAATPAYSIDSVDSTWVPEIEPVHQREEIAVHFNNRAKGTAGRNMKAKVATWKKYNAFGHAVLVARHGGGC